MLHGRAQERAAEMGVGRALISLTHSKSAAVAVVVLEKDS
jgi:phosphopantetheinyl transferase (holo-ACP synthase)